MAQALARARRRAEEDRSRRRADRCAPEFGVPTLLAARADPPLVDPGLQPAPLTPHRAPGGRSVRELPVGELIGRRRPAADGDGGAAPQPRRRCEGFGAIGPGWC